jgi:lactoylglutathione lyase
MISELFPIISTPDIERSLGFYRDLLGGRVTFSFPGEDGAPAYVGLDLGASHIGIGLRTDGGEGTQQRAISLWVYAADADALVERVRSAGGTVTEDPADQPWGERVGRVLDPDENEVVIGQKLA